MRTPFFAVLPVTRFHGRDVRLVPEFFATVGDAYRQEYRPGIAEDFAEVVKTDAEAGGPSGQYTNVVVTEDTDLLDKAKFEHKWFAPGVGQIGTDGMVGGHHEIRTLVAILATQ